MTRYNTEIEQKMCAYYGQLSEKDQRHYSVIEALKLGYGGKKYIGQLFQTSQSRLNRGAKELNDKKMQAEIPIGP